MMDESNTSMAGLTDMSMGEVKRLDDADDSKADGDFSMAEIPLIDDTDDSGRAGDSGGHRSAALPKGNILDELKKEAGILGVKDSEDVLDQKRRMLNDSVNAFAEVDESDYDSEEESKDGAMSGDKIKRKSFGKAQRRSMGRGNRESITSSGTPD